MFQQPPLRFLPPFFKILSLFSLMLLSTQIMFFAAAYMVHQYFGVQDSEAFSANIDLQAANPMASLVMQAIGTGLGAFLLPSMMFSVLAYGGIGTPLKLNFYPSLKQLLLVVAIIVSAGIFVSLLVDLNKLIPLPPSLSFLKDFQQKYDTLLNAFFKDVDLMRLLLLTLVLAVMPAIGEELFFRGALLKIFSETRLGIHGAIFFSALAFSLMHFEFYNTFAIFFMGILLGYIYFFTQSIWASITAHFVNNFAQVFLKYLFSIGIISTDVTTIENLPIYFTFGAGLIMLGFLWLLMKNKSAIVEETIDLEPTNNSTEQ